ncbi:MAG TPA: SDR family NAD(P)-dependent oxidoreductase [Armatimonadota bacterium]|nr:SDR family NAD(P)-dependent oxidoreductase [Armatimonadota bacterium]
MIEKKLAGKVALVTGGARGLGRAYALRLADLGADIVLNDICLDAYKEFNEEIGAESVAAELEARGVRALAVQADVSDRAQVESMVELSLERFGRLDILVNNAGGMLRPIDKSHASRMSEDEFRYILDINLSATIFCCQVAAAPMKAQGSGKIVNVSSQAGLRGNGSGMMAAYSVSKAAIVEYTRLLAGELGPFGINVNCIAPGLILTSRANAQFGRHLPENQAKAIPGIPLRRLGLPEDCAKVVEFLVTDLSDYVTGQCIPICGGMVLSPS